MDSPTHSTSYWLAINHNGKDTELTNLYRNLDEAIMNVITETDGELYQDEEKIIWYDGRLSGSKSNGRKIKMEDLKKRIKTSMCFRPGKYSGYEFGEEYYSFEQVKIGKTWSLDIKTVSCDRCTYCQVKIPKVEDTDDYLLYTCQDCRFDCSDCGITDVPKEMGQKCGNCGKLICSSHYIPHIRKCSQVVENSNPELRELYVSYYPDPYSKSKLYRSDDGIIIKSINFSDELMAIGSNLKAAGEIQPLTEEERRKVQNMGIKIDESWNAGSTGDPISAKDYIEKYM